MNLSEAIGEFIDWCRLDKGRSPHTVVAYRCALNGFLELVGDMPMGSVSRSIIRDYQRWVAQQSFATSTRALKLVALRSFLHFAAREDWTPGDMGSTVDVPKRSALLPKPLDEADRLHLLAALPHGTLQERRDWALILFLLSTGCRVSEALALDRDAVRAERVTVKGKGDKQRIVTLTDRARSATEGYLKMRNDPSPALWIGFSRPSLGKRDNRLTPTGVRSIFAKIARALDIPVFGPHQLRHTLGTLLQEETGDAVLTASTLGHSGLASVKGYVLITSKRRDDAYAKIAERGL